MDRLSKTAAVDKPLNRPQETQAMPTVNALFSQKVSALAQVPQCLACKVLSTDNRPHIYKLCIKKALVLFFYLISPSRVLVGN